MASQLRLLTLNEGENQEGVVFRLERGWTLWFVLGPSLADTEVRVFVNHPSDPRAEPSRHTYREVEWQNMSGTKSDVFDNFAEVRIVMGGSFNYYFTIDGSDKRESANGQGFFLIDPVLKVGKYDERLPLDSITCQTVLAKQLGPFDEWEGRLRVAKESSYNMIHFTPLQDLGYSNSAYSLADQLKLNHMLSRDGKYTFDDVEKLVKRMKEDWEVLSLTDMVYNHTANNSPWVQEHPECAYNCVNSPHLKPAYLLDRVLWHLSIDVGEGKYADQGIPAEICLESHLNAIEHLLNNEIFPRHNLQEFYLVPVEVTLQQFRSSIRANVQPSDSDGQLQIIQDPKYRRWQSTVDIRLAIRLYHFNREGLSQDDNLSVSCGELRRRLDELNRQKNSEIQSHLAAAVKNFLANARWRLLDPNGPRLKKVCVESEDPIMYNYFTHPTEDLSLEEEEGRMHTEQGAFCMAHNGWVMTDDPMRNFAEPGSNVYLRRELIPWGDSVKLRYGAGPDDCPFLWNLMAEYTRYTARIFHGIRLDNCHSTPIHVAEYMLDEARKVRPDLYVIAELFTSSEYMDHLFINRLGINSLIREALNAWEAHELGRLVHRFGGEPVGSFMQPPARPLMPTMAHALLMDQTHDNPSPIEKRTPLDPLPTAGLVAMACCASGSNRGYDELVPHHIHVVTEKRLYPTWTEEEGVTVATVNRSTGIIAAKEALNKLHADLGQQGFSQLFVDDRDKDTVAVTRHNPTSHQSVILVARTAFSQPSGIGGIPSMLIEGFVEEIIIEASMQKKEEKQAFEKDKVFINGLPEYSCYLQQNIAPEASKLVTVMIVASQEESLIDFYNFPHGSIIAFRVSLPPEAKKSVLKIRSCLAQFGYRVHTISGRNLQEITINDMENIASKLSLNDLNRVLYRCGAEEADDGLGIGPYNIPGHGPLVYCGLQGLISVLSTIRLQNNLGHPLCGNLREGDWMPQYVASRLVKHAGTAELGQWLHKVFSYLAGLPRYLIPSYFDAILTGVYMVVQEVAWALMPQFVTNGSSFVRALALGSVQMCSIVPTAYLPPLSPRLAEPIPKTTLDPHTKMDVPVTVSLAAGLPHFSSGIFRNWGRDTFIAMRGLMLLTGRFQEARYIILAFAGCLRHGLIPNLLGSGVAARYNCRDAVWWWLQCIQDFTKMAPDGVNILQDRVTRMYPTDESQPQMPGKVEQSLCEVMQEALQNQATGGEFRERNAGAQIDREMADRGFNIKIGIDWNTGFVYGGNEHNCGTWMDKMGSSEKAGNKGKPATPRDGSAVELVGLCKSTVRWLGKLHGQGLYPYDGVAASIPAESMDVAMKVTFSEWDRKLNENFEKYFWVDNSGGIPQGPRADLINKRGIYKDSVGACPPWADFQLRPNFSISMVVAPELFNPSNAWTALDMVEKYLLGPLGIRTLDPEDWAYNGNYVNSDDSDDPKRAKGFNYHQGPEWLWPVGYFLRAKLLFAQKLNKDRPGILQETKHFIKCVLARHNMHIRSSEWKSLPELTNKDGADCPDSCPAQAWSMGCILEVLYDMEVSNSG